MSNLKLNSATRFDKDQILSVLEQMGETEESGAVELIFDASYDRAQFYAALCNHGLARLIEQGDRTYECLDFDAP